MNGGNDGWETVGKSKKNRKNTQPQGSKDGGGGDELYQGQSSSRSNSSASSGTALNSRISNVSNSGKLDWTERKKENSITFLESKSPEKDNIRLSVNYFGLSNLILPRFIYHYEVTSRLRKTYEDCNNNNKMSRNQISTPQKLSQPIPQKIMEKLIKNIYQEYEQYNGNSRIGIVSDLSNNLYSTKEFTEGITLEQTIKLLDVAEVSEEDSFQVSVKRSKLKIDTSTLLEYAETTGSWRNMTIETSVKTQTEQVYNALIRSIPRCPFIPVGRSGLIWWPKEGDIYSLGSGVVCWEGIYANFTMGWKLLLNMDMTYATFYKSGEALKVIEEIDTNYNRNNCWDPPRFILQKVEDILKNCRVEYNVKVEDKLTGKLTIKNLTGRIFGIKPKSVGNTHFVFTDSDSGKQMDMSVETYYRKTYPKMKLKYPNGPCLILNRGKSFVPAELCSILPGRQYERKLSDSQTNKLMIRARKDPSDLRKSIENSLRVMNPGVCKELKEFGVTLNEKLLEKNDVKVLPPPDILYGEGLVGLNQGQRAVITPEDGEWDVWSHQFKFHEGRNIPNYGFLILNNTIDQRIITSFINELKKWSSKRGVNFSKKNPVVETLTLQFSKANEIAQNNVRDLENKFKNGFKLKGVELVIVILPKKDQEIYGQVKRAAEIHVGILTQCITKDNFLCIANAEGLVVVQNLVCKLNVKLGGTNHVPLFTSPILKDMFVDKIWKCPILILGADVTHPPPNLSIYDQNKKRTYPSFAAVTGCIQKTVMPYMMEINAQEKANKGAAEIIKCLDIIVQKMLITFKQKTGGIPRKIMMYRDGVGEGQFKEVLENEMEAIRNACKQVGRDYDGSAYEPKITFITVQKRNKTRFFHHNSDEKITNAPAGTLFDTDIVHQKDTDFYLLSHKGVLGTSRPTRYRVLHDDSELTVDQIKVFTNYLCYTYQRCNRSVRIPAPTYYAHYAASRAKAFVEGMDKKDMNSMGKLNQSLKRNAEFVAKYPMHFI